MKLSYNWLNDFADFNSVPFEKLLEKINLSICETDDVYEYMPHLSTIVAAKILEAAKHPDADKLTVCTADIGSEKLQIVTGAKVSVGDIVPLAKIGTIFPDGKEIKEGKLRGVDSFGMFCSEKELGLAEDSSGLYQLPSDSKLGQSLREILGFEDKIFDIDNKSITHRPDLWSHFGFARELAAQLDLKIKHTPFDSKFSFTGKNKATVIENKNAHSYFASILTGIEIKESIPKIKNRLTRCGVRAINNVVDVSNYIMLEMGQPTHFFDKAKLETISLEVDYGKESEKIKLLDGTERELSPSQLLIRNAGKPVALAGVMGGEETAISSTTKESVLESAVFKREDIRKTIRTTGIRSEASVRYEKGQDSFLSLPVINRSLNLLKENGCPNLEASEQAGFEHKKSDVVIQTTFSFINQKLGKDFDTKTVIHVLERLGFALTINGDNLSVKVPPYRHNYDITIQEDLVEEVGRSLGYAAIDHRPLLSDVKPVVKNSKRELEKRLKNIFVNNLGYSEVFNYSFTSKKDNGFEGNDFPLAIANAMPEESKFLRTSIYPALLRNIASNSDRFESIKIFEYGRTYHKTKKEELADEKRWFGFAVLKNRKPDDIASLEEDFLSVRNDIEILLDLLGLQGIDRMRKISSYLHPNAAVEFQYRGETIAELGFLHPKHSDTYNLKKRVLIGKFCFDTLERLIVPENMEFKFIPPSQFPQDQLDISLIMDKNRETQQYENLVKKLLIPEIQSVWVHDIYTGTNVLPEKKSVTYRISLLNYKETFTQAHIKEITDKLIKLAADNGFALR